MSDTMITMLALLAAELLLLLLVLLSVAWFRGRAARRRDERAIRLLVTRIRNSRAERETGIERFLDERMGLSGAELEQAKQAILQSELVLLKRFAEVYRGRDADAAARFDADLITALTPYHELKADNVVVASEPAPADNSELEKLREQNQLLSDELSGNMETMSKMLREFSTMFAGSSGDAAAPPAATTEPPADPAAETVPVAGPSQAPASDSPDPLADTASTAAASESVAADESAEPDLGTPESVDTQFAEAGQPGSAVDAGEVSEPLPPVEEPVTAGVPEGDIAREANAEVPDQAPPEPVATAQSGPAAEGVSGVAAVQESQSDAAGDTARDDPEPEMPAQSKVQIEAGDDLDEVAELLEEEGPAEVVTFDDPDEFDAEVAQSGGKAFDAEESEILAALQAQGGDLPGPEGDAGTPKAGEGVDAIDEAPLKAQSRG
jgi:hypothetical protein